jgi:ABC-type antimicrobial peptide transport system permease subunit
LVGLIGGFLLSLLLMPMLSRLLFGVKPGNAVNYGIILTVVLLVSALAAAFPVRRATGIDPLIALRYE